jgi:hypothetical protein
VTNEPEQGGYEYPSLEKSAQPSDLPPPIDYPSSYPTYPPTPPMYPQPAPYVANPYGPPPLGYGVPPYGVVPQQKTNGLAIGALVTSLVAIPSCAGFGVMSIVAIMLGLIGMNQIRRTGEKGYGMALSGVIIGAATLVLFALFIVIAIATDSN